MPRRAIIRTVSATALALGALLAGALIAGPAAAAPVAARPITAAALAAPRPAVAAPAALALDDCCQLRVNGLPGRMVAGADPVMFVVTFTNTSQQIITSSMQMTFTFNGAGQVNSGSVVLKRKRANGDWQGVNIGHRNGKLVGTDSIRIFGQNMIPPGGSTQFQYQMAWGAKVPSLQVSLDLALTGRLGFGNGNRQTQELAASGGHQFVVGGAAPPTTAKPTPPSTPPSTPTEEPTTTAPQTPGNLGAPSAPPVIPQGDTSSGGSSVVWIAYIVGALLLLGGIGVIGYMLWRRGPQMIESEWEEEPPPGYAASHRMPAQRPLPGPGYGQTYDAPTVHGDIEVLPPPRGGRHSADPTRQFDPTREYDPR